MDSVNNIAVVGGGSAGYLTALYLKKKYPDWSVTLIESSKIPVIGVGEATTPRLLRYLHYDLGISVREFFKEVKPTLKLGVKFDWGKSGNYYFNNPFGLLSIGEPLYYTGDINNSSLLSLLMNANKSPLVRENGQIVPLNLLRGFAYHIDNKIFVKFLQNKREEFGINYIDTTISSFSKGKGEEIDFLIDENRNELRFDFYFDCTGFKSQLLGDYLNSEFISWNHLLFTNSAITGVLPNEGKIKPYTSAITMNHGWLWNVPMRDSDHLGYVYDNNCVSEKDATDEFINKYPGVEIKASVSFKPGRYKESWKGNVVALGNAFAFIEPIESTGIHMILTQLKRFDKAYRNNGLSDLSKEEYNHRVNSAWDQLRDFIVIHFKFNSKLQTPFWKKYNDLEDVPQLNEYLEFYAKSGPISYYPDHPLNKQLANGGAFGPFAHDLILAGCGFAESKLINREKLDARWEDKFGFNKKLLEKAIPHEEGLSYLETIDFNDDFIKNWF